MPIRKPCRKCGKQFQPLGKFCYYCEDCLKKMQDAKTKRNRMKKYWKVKIIEDLLKIRSKEREESTIIMKYNTYQKELKNLMQQAYEDGLVDAKCEVKE